METWIESPITLGSELLESMTDEQFLKFCHDNPTVRFERTADHKILVMAPTGSVSSFFHGELFFQLKLWDRSAGKGMCFESSGGFKMNDDSIRAADMAWVAIDRWEALAPESKQIFASICPDFVLELRSQSDSLKYLQSKMLEWIENGVQLGFLIDPLEKVSYVYRANGSVDRLEGFERELSGEDVLPGFALDLRVLLG